jgi:hypothetical protein
LRIKEKESYSWFGLSIDGSGSVGDNWSGPVDNGSWGINGWWWGRGHVDGSFSGGWGRGGGGGGSCGRWRSWDVVVAKVSSSIAGAVAVSTVATTITITVTVSGTISSSGTISRS